MDKPNRLKRRALTAIVIAALATVIGAVFAAPGTGLAAGTAPKNNTEPAISGTPQQGQTLTADHGDWSGTTPISYSYQWQRCNPAGNNCAGISGANSRLYDLKSQDVGHSLRVRVTAKNSAGSTAAVSNATGTVLPATAPTPKPTTGCPAGSGAVNVADLSSPARLIIDSFTSSPSVLTKQVGTLTIRVHISACSGRAVTGALVYAAAVPFNQFTVSEVQTDSTGWATIPEQQQNGYPANPGRQTQLTVFLRARKAGEPQGQGVSTSKLVAFPIRLH
ncbi:MAG TPA: hypothetical protein VGU02_13150 [Gaiellaceae bacterium]|nr:hypothetical protein [Gaiellaceae bacterium]